MPATTTTRSSQTRSHLFDLVMHARGSSRSVCAAEARVVRSIVRDDDPDAFVDYRLAVDDLLAALAPELVDRARQIDAALGGVYTEAIADMCFDESDKLIKPIFERAGRVDDFMPAAERFPGRPDLADEAE